MSVWDRSVYNHVHRTMHRKGASRKAHAALRPIAALLCLVAAACITPGVIQQGQSGPATPRDPDARDSGGHFTPVASKTVYGKESPSTLVANDGSRCTVTSKKFEKTREGDRVLCAWRKS